MNYSKLYDQIIERGKTRILEGYKEKHHIIPKCMGGTDEPENIVELTAREHFIVHKLLTEIYPKENGLHFAVFSMCTLKNKWHERTYKIGAREYDRLRSNMVMSDHVRETLRQANLGRKDSKERIEKRMSKVRGRKHTEEAKRLMSENSKGFVTSEETKRKISLAKRGVKKPPMSEQQKKDISASMKKYWENKKK